MKCLLCQSPSILNINEVFDCSFCGLIFKDPKNYYDHDKDVLRYSTHNNNAEDQGYIKFLNLLIKPLMQFVSPKNFKALDFGCGPGPTLSRLLAEHGGVVENYDPLFFINDEALKTTYDVVTSSEVVEHFKNPSFDWQLLVGLVKPGGVLAIMTLLKTPQIDYKNWWYKNDPTHVAFYSEKTLDYLADRFGLEIIYNDKKSVIIFKK